MQRNPEVTRGCAAEKSKGSDWLHDRLQAYAPSRDSAQPQTHRYHANADKRRIKTVEELREGLELIELADRKSPGLQIRGARR